MNCGRKFHPSYAKAPPTLTRLGSLRAAIAVVTGIVTLYMGLAVANFLIASAGLIVTQLKPQAG